MRMKRGPTSIIRLIKILPNSQWMLKLSTHPKLYQARVLAPRFSKVSKRWCQISKMQAVFSMIYHQMQNKLAPTRVTNNRNSIRLLNSRLCTQFLLTILKEKSRKILWTKSSMTKIRTHSIISKSSSVATKRSRSPRSWMTREVATTTTHQFKGYSPHLARQDLNSSRTNRTATSSRPSTTQQTSKIRSLPYSKIRSNLIDKTRRSKLNSCRCASIPCKMTWLMTELLSTS